jgi:D-3-phosphoglycerate dehydrogenase / 2-oxoglutarate reductase
MKIPFKILIADEVHYSLMNMLQAIGIAFTYAPAITREALKEQLPQYQGLIIRSKTIINADLLGPKPSIKFIGRAGAGLDLFDLNLLQKLDIEVFAANAGNADTVAEHVMGMILCLLNQLHVADSQVRQSIWLREANRGTELMGKTWGIIGYGHNGKATAKRLASFGLKVLAYDHNPSIVSDSFAAITTMEQLYADVDFLSLHIPLSGLSIGMVNDGFLANFSKNIYLINTARGELIQWSALLNGLQNGKILGACLDVLPNENLNKLKPEESKIFAELVKMDNILFSPHIAGWSHESYVRINEVLVANIERYIFENKG